MAPQKLTPKEFGDWLSAVFHGDPAEARAFCERTMNPNYLRLQAGGGRTDFEIAVEKVAMFRTICKKWEASVTFLVQEDNKIAAQIKMEMELGEGPEKKMELMFMGTRDDQGRFENVWELSSDLEEGAK
ncbi:hypothetical protein V497_05301 [Pseudogymnoascus sp. VKM F-4516 (FW-969)]|nr:hypothetical protein V490_03230 [Pseudogymnoascus sp. VKM F-3557]KFY57750.1 hypothetical protein V497_05301 [Pseudogymnoascus sp. VKM F-4516 (FW-969)]